MMRLAVADAAVDVAVIHILGSQHVVELASQLNLAEAQFSGVPEVAYAHILHVVEHDTAAGSAGVVEVLAAGVAG